jgi:signal transduction histidine kinase/class 3 adenylate cyclase
MGAKLSLFTFFLLFLATINDILFSQQIIHTIFLIPFGVVIFTLAQSYILASLSKKAYRTAEHLSNHLKDEVNRQTVELKENNVKLKELDKQKTHFFQNVSHELRTPLTLIMNPLKNELSKTPNNKNIEVAEKNSKRLFRLVNQLLDFQKASSKKNKLNLAHIDIVQFIKTCAEYFEPTCKAKNIKFMYDIETDQSISILGHVDALEKVIFNYLSNALKYTSKNGTIVLSITTKNKLVRISVKDSGIGITKEDQAKLFQVFSQVDDSTIRDYEGTGLGLALVKELVTEMKGEVGVESKLNFGSTFYAEFPISKSEKTLLDLLIVDDDKNILEHLQSGLAMSLPNLSFKTVPNAEEAKKILDKCLIKVFATDYNMPGDNGVTLLKYVNMTQPNCKKVLMTGNIDPNIIQTAINEVKIDNVQYKPLNIGEFSEIIEGLIALSTVKEIAKVELDKFSPKEWNLVETLPIKYNKDNEDKESESTSTAINKGLIIVVDDIPDMRKIIAKDISEHGYKTITACDGVDGLEKIRKHNPDLIITDWMMPKMSGPELIQEVLRDKQLSTTPTILLTAKNDDESKLLGTKTGATAYLGKPFDELELLSTIKNLLNLKDGERKIKELNKHISENVLKRFLPPTIVDDIIKGTESLDDKPKMLPVTVLFSDLSEFTNKTTLLGPNKMLRILNTYLEEMTKVIFECGGNIDKFIGDSIMVIFGAPNTLSSQDQAQKAQTCAILMQEKLNELNEAWKLDSMPEFKMRIGIHHGPAIVGYLGSEKRTDYTAIGSTVNLAARIEGAANPGEIFISETFRDLITEGTWEKAGSFELKGFSNKVTLFKITTESVNKKAA